MKIRLSYPASRPSASVSLKFRAAQGFALIATISIMVLLVMIALAMLSLSTIELRSSQNGRAMVEAQANARMALMMALGELQKYAGPDTRITAPADILDANNPPLTGVWRSWEGSDHEQEGDLIGRPTKPNYEWKDKAQADDANGRFLRWLVSGGSEQVMRPSAVGELVASTPPEDFIPMVSSGSLADDDLRQVHVAPTPINETGSYAWWVSGENQKARAPKPYEPEQDDAASWAEHNGSHSVADPSVFGMDALLTDTESAEKIFTLNMADLAADEDAETKPSQSFHDLSATSIGLLTNVATGGWRKDLSLLTERWEEQPLAGLELFQLAPGVHQEFTRPKPVSGSTWVLPSEHVQPGSVFYPWSDYRFRSNRNQQRQYFHRRASVSSWASMVNHAIFYKEIDVNSAGLPSIEARSWAYHNSTGPLNTYHGLHSTRILPQMARFQMILSHYATRDYQAYAPGKLRPAVLYTPVITLWNPFNYEIRMPSGYFHISSEYAMPIALKYNSLANDYWAVQRPTWDQSYPNGLRISTNRGWQFEFGSGDLVFKPGETRVFSPAEGELYDETYARRESVISPGVTIQMKPGVRYETGYYYGLDRILEPMIPEVGNRREILEYIETNVDRRTLTLNPGFTMQVDAKFDVVGQQRERVGMCGMHTQWNVNRRRNPEHGIYWSCYYPADADELHPPQQGLAGASLAECEGNPVPFLSMIYGSRIASQSHQATKGMVQCSPLVTFSSSAGYSWYADDYPGTYTMTSSPWDFSYVPHASGPGDDMMPNADNTTFSGYIVTGVRKADGIDRVIATDLPVRPLLSIADLTHWRLRGNNPVPPHGHNLIGNSDAAPLIPSNNVVDPSNNAYADKTSNEQQDDSYCANHLLFDDWFFSSIAPEPTTIGPDGKSLKENYREFLEGKDPLANRAYKPILEDLAASRDAADATYNEQVLPKDSWKTIASRLEVEGMFNVNSTSVKAWRALLRHARNQKIPYLSGPAQVDLSGSTDYAFPRSGVSGHAEAGRPVPGSYFATSEFAGYRVFTEDMLDGLAELIVEQVRLRGPFLSLSEFINRQLSDDEDLAIGGAIQVALNKLARDSSINPFDVMQGESVPSISNPPGQHDYAFGKAAEGYNTYGLPGWTRQADILRPLAPILSARDDTFTIRAYGDSRDIKGNVVARAWCEASVKRTRNFCDSADDPDITTLPQQRSNKDFGRKFIITSFRWLNASEV